jgi:hypothetical protein
MSNRKKRLNGADFYFSKVTTKWVNHRQPLGLQQFPEADTSQICGFVDQQEPMGEPHLSPPFSVSITHVGRRRTSRGTHLRSA